MSEKNDIKTCTNSEVLESGCITISSTSYDESGYITTDDSDDEHIHNTGTVYTCEHCAIPMNGYAIGPHFETLCKECSDIANHTNCQECKSAKRYLKHLVKAVYELDVDLSDLGYVKPERAKYIAWSHHYESDIMFQDVVKCSIKRFIGTDRCCFEDDGPLCSSFDRNNYTLSWNQLKKLVHAKQAFKNSSES